MMIPPMVEKGYDRDFSAALTASAGSLGVLIPPSIPMVLYCIAGEVSIGEMFMAGFIPGFLMTAALALTTYVISKKNGYKSDEGEFEWKKVAASFKEAIWPLLAPVIILGGIYSGIFTPTEAAVVVVVYSMFVGLFITKELKVSDLPGILYKRCSYCRNHCIHTGICNGIFTLSHIKPDSAAHWKRDSGHHGQCPCDSDSLCASMFCDRNLP